MPRGFPRGAAREGSKGESPPLSQRGVHAPREKGRSEPLTSGAGVGKGERGAGSPSPLTVPGDGITAASRGIFGAESLAGGDPPS